VCVKKDFDDLYNKITDDGRELRVIHGGVVEVTYQPVPSARNITLQENPFGTPESEKQAPTQQEVSEAPAPTQEDAQPAQVYSYFYLSPVHTGDYRLSPFSAAVDYI